MWPICLPYTHRTRQRTANRRFVFGIGRGNPSERNPPSSPRSTAIGRSVHTCVIYCLFTSTYPSARSNVKSGWIVKTTVRLIRCESHSSFARMIDWFDFGIIRQFSFKSLTRKNLSVFKWFSFDCFSNFFENLGGGGRRARSMRQTS